MAEVVAAGRASPQDSAAEESDFSPRKLKIAFACLVGTMLAGPLIAQGAVTLVMAPLQKAFAWSRADIGLAVTLMTWATAVSLPFAGRLVDRVDARRVLIAAAALTGLATAGLALTGGRLPVFYAGYIVIGLLGGVGVAYTRIVSALFTRHRGKALSIFQIDAQLVAAVLPPVMLVVMLRFGWQGLYVALGLVALLVATPVLVAFLKDPTRSAGPAAGAPAVTLEGMSTGQALKSLPFWMLLVANIGGGFTIYGLLPHFVGMVTSHGLTPAEAVGGLSLLSIFICAGQLVAGFVVDKLQTARIAAAFLVLFLIGIFMISRATAATGVLPLYAGIALMGFGGGSQVPMGFYFFTRYFGLKSLAEITGLYRALQAVLTAPAPWLIGVVYDRTHAYDFAFYLFMGGCITSIVVLALLPAYRYAVTPTKPA